jgi:hypothetical protein
VCVCVCVWCAFCPSVRGVTNRVGAGSLCAGERVVDLDAGPARAEPLCVGRRQAHADQDAQPPPSHTKRASPFFFFVRCRFRQTDLCGRSSRSPSQRARFPSWRCALMTSWSTSTKWPTSAPK